MAHVNERLGGRPCPLCGAGLVVRKNPAGTLTINCNGDTGCDFSGFAKKGTKAAELLAPAKAEPAAPAAAPAPASKPARQAAQPFSIGGLS